MESIGIFIFLQVILWSVPESIQQQNAISLPWSWSRWSERIAFHRIIKLTELIVKDVTYKLRHAEKIQEQHKHSITFELGSIAAGILDHFKVMLAVYRYYADEITFMRKAYPAAEYMDCFHRIPSVPHEGTSLQTYRNIIRLSEGEYHEIRMEQGMFYDIVRDYEATMGGTTKFTIPPGFTLPPRGARRFVTNPMNSSVTRPPEIKSTKKRVQKRKKMKKPLWKPAL